jgi:hypothetical protein
VTVVYFKGSRWWEKCGAGPSSKLEGPTEYVECEMDVEFMWVDSYVELDGSCFMITWDYFQTRSLGGGRLKHQIVGRPWRSERLQLLVMLFKVCVRACVNRCLLE